MISGIKRLDNMWRGKTRGEQRGMAAGGAIAAFAERFTGSGIFFIERGGGKSKNVSVPFRRPALQAP